MPSVVVDAKAAANVEILGVKALMADLLDEADHDLGCIPEDIHLCDCGAQVAVHTRQLQQRLLPYSVQEPLQEESVSTRHPPSRQPYKIANAMGHAWLYCQLCSIPYRVTNGAIIAE